MAKLSIVKGATSVLVRIFVQDATKADGSGKTGLVAASFTGTKMYVARDDDGNAAGTAVTLTDGTRGTWGSGTIKEKDAANMPGVYELGLTNASLAGGSRTCDVFLTGTNLVPVVLEIELTGPDNQDAVRGGMTALPNVASGSAGAIPTTGTGSNQISVSSGQVIIQAGTGTGQLDFTAGVVKANLTQCAGGTVPAGAIPNAVAGAAGGLFIAGTNAATTVTTSFTTTFTGALTGDVQGKVLGGGVSAFTAVGVQSDMQTIKTQTVTCAAGVTVNPNVGTTQPVNFTGTGASALVNNNTVDWGGTAVTLTANLPDVNVKRINGVVAASPGAAGGILIAGSNAATTFATLTVSGATVFSGGVTGNITGNLIGTVTGTPTWAVPLVVSQDTFGFDAAGKDLTYHLPDYGLPWSTSATGVFALSGDGAVRYTSPNDADVAWIDTGSGDHGAEWEFSFKGAVGADFGLGLRGDANPWLGAWGILIECRQSNSALEIRDNTGVIATTPVTWNTSATYSGRACCHGTTITVVLASTALAFPVHLTATSSNALTSTVVGWGFGLLDFLTNTVQEVRQWRAFTMPGTLPFAVPGLVSLTGPSWYTTPPTTAAIATAVLTDTGDNTTAGSPGKILAQLNTAFGGSGSVFTIAALANAPAGGGGGGDPWATVGPGSYVLGTFGYRVWNTLGLITSLTVAGSSAPSGTVISALAAYATSADMLNRFDANVLLQLVSDTGTRVTTTGALATNPIMVEALKAASGWLEAACLAGGRYQPADLVALAGTNSGSFLLDLVCGLAVSWIGDRRLNKDRVAYPLAEKALAALAMLAKGETIFGLLAQAQAGITGHEIELSSDVEARDTAVEQAERLFGRRANRTSRNG